MRTMEVVIKPVTYSAILQAPNAQALFDAYSAECSIPEIGACSPQEQTYANLEHSGTMYCFGAFKGESLIGFATVLCYTGTHYAEKVATVESIFISPEHRELRVARNLMAEVESTPSSRDAWPFSTARRRTADSICSSLSYPPIATPMSCTAGG
jgi:hypothetical protein